MTGAIAAVLLVPFGASQDPQAKTGDQAATRWIEQLGADDFEARQTAEKELRELGASARDPLSEAAESHPDPEVRWRARRILRGGDRRGLEGRPGADGRAGSEGRVDPDESNAERGRWGPIEDDRVRRLLQGWDLEAFDGLRGPGELRTQLEEFQRRQAELFDRLRSGGIGDLGSRAGTSVEIGPDGVRVQVDDGAGEPETYEAPDLDSFREKHPEVAERFLDGGGFRLDLDGLTPGLRPLRQLELPDARRMPVAPPPDGERLGVTVRDAHEAVLRFLGLEPGRGLVVTEVLEGSLAGLAGVEVGDLVLAVAGTEVFDASDVRRALAPIAKGEKVEIEVNRRGTVRMLEAEKQHGASAEAERPRGLRGR